ncbi:MAG: glycosyltransferase family 4 protein [Opitutaceae bacterium]|nr:glycosyltransferase family 4 protein [Opitutaceae bacterium]MBP9911794.1 glycosyltransferase family 4 protein [Opitutaceae bacterium]
MITCPVLSYGFSHHLFQQAAELSRRVPGYRMVTTSFVSDRTVTRLRPLFPSLARSLARRSHPGVPADIVRTYPVEHSYQLAARLTRHSYSYFAAHDRMARRILCDFSPPGTVLAIDTGAENLFRAWKGRSRCILDLSIATPHYREKIFSEAEASPNHHGVRFHHPGPWELSRYAAELELADLILCPSEFVMDSCRHLGVPAERLRLLPYGFEPGRFAPAASPRPNTPPLRIVFAGTFFYRKGSHLLLEAFARFQSDFPQAELHVFGEVIDRPRHLPANVTLHGRVPQETLAVRFREMDVMAFPTLFEGSAYVAYQALASGLPVITTRNCGSVVDASCGIILDEISADALYHALVRCQQNRPWLASLAAAAPVRVGHYTWSHYGERLYRILTEGAAPATASSS